MVKNYTGHAHFKLVSRVKEEIFVYITRVACFSAYHMNVSSFISRLATFLACSAFPIFSSFPARSAFLACSAFPAFSAFPQIPHATKQLRTSPHSVQAPLHTFRSSTPAYMLLKHRSPIVMAKCHIFVILLLLFRAQFRNNYSLNTLDGFRNLHSQNALHFQGRPLCSLDI